MVNNVILTVGASGSGKSTWALNFIEQNHTYFYINADLMRSICGHSESDQTVNYKVFATLENMIEYMMKLKHDILIDNTNITRKQRKTWITLAQKYGYKIQAIVFKTPINECLRRNGLRERQVPIDVIQRQHENFQEPTKEEGIDIIEYVETT